jgi:hypothetical protein
MMKAAEDARFGVGALAHLLKNRFYIGEVAYRGEVHRGEHEPILDSALFGAVQGKLAAQAVARRCWLRGSPAILTGRLFDGRSAQFIRKYGFASVFLARFTAVVRAFVYRSRLASQEVRCHRVASRVLILGSTRPTLISLLSLPMISVGVTNRLATNGLGA